MGKRGIFGAILTLIGGYFYGYASGIVATINYALTGISDITADIVSKATFGLGGSLGRELGNSISYEFRRYIMSQIGDSIGGLKLVGVVFILAGLMFSFIIKEGTGIKKVKRKIVVKSGTKTAKCPTCQFPLDVTGQSEGTCPQCKTDVEILFQG